jgi:FkbM family methyltransferase
MMVNRFDYNNKEGFSGVGSHLLDRGTDNLDSTYILAHYLNSATQPVVIDVGANIGVLTVQSAAMIEPIGGHVYAFEPQRQIFYMMCGNIAMNNIDNVSAERLAVGNSNKPITVPKLNYYQPGSFGSVGFTGEFDDVGQDLDFGNGEKVDQIVIDEYFKDVENIKFIKVDVEGMELDVLKGAEQTIKQHRPWMYIEYCKQPNQGKELREFIESMDYDIYVLSINFLCIPKEHIDVPEYQFVKELRVE